MSKLTDYFRSLTQRILGGIPTQNKEVSRSLEEIDARLNKTSYSNLFEMLVNLSNQSKAHVQNGNGVSKVTDLIDVSDDYRDQVYDLFRRREKYKAYLDMMKKISRLARVIKVLRSNIISSDNLRNRVLLYTSRNINIDSEKSILEIKQRFQHLKIDTHKTLAKIIDNTLRYGDYFAEIVVRKKLLSKKIQLIESDFKREDIKEIKIEDQIIEGKSVRLNVRLESNLLQSPLLESVDKDDDTIVLDDIMIMYHKPHNVIKLTLGDIVYGYIIVPENILKTKLFFQDMNILDTAEKVHMRTKSMGIDYMFSQKALDRSVKIIDRIIEFLKENVSKEAIESNLALKSVITKLVFSSIFSVGVADRYKGILDDMDTLKICNIDLRFVDASKMQEFTINVDEYDPYGTSIFDSVVFDSKLLISDKITSSIERLTKSIERRIINFEIDDRNSSAIIEILKEKFRKRKTIFSGETTFDNVPSLISPFEEYYIPTRDGTPFINFTTEPPTSHHQGRADDMRFKRDEIVGSLNVPPAYVGLEENIESKATLFLQNILFSVEVMDYQENFSEDLTELADKLSRILDVEADRVKVGFALPIILSSASELEHINTISGIEDFLNKMGLDNRNVRERYMPFLNEYFTDDKKTFTNLENLKYGDEEKDAEEGEF